MVSPLMPGDHHDKCHGTFENYIKINQEFRLKKGVAFPGVEPAVL